MPALVEFSGGPINAGAPSFGLAGPGSLPAILIGQFVARVGECGGAPDQCGTILIAHPFGDGIYVLAGELHGAKGDHRQAFDAYEAQVRGFVTGKQSSAGKLIPVFATQTWMGIRLRNLVMRAINFDPVGDLLVGRSLRDTFVLPDYGM